MMRDCDFYEIHLSDYVAGDLGRDQGEALEGHLAGCADCRAELARERELRRLLTSLPVAPCPVAVTRRLGEAVGEDRPVSRVRTVRLPWARLASAGLVAAALAVALLVPALRDGAPPATGGAVVANDATYSQAEIDQARRDVIAVLALTADVLDRSHNRTMTEIFGDRLPGAVNGSLRPAGRPHAPDAHTPNSANGASDNGGQG